MFLILSSNVVFKEIFRRSLWASPLTNPCLTPSMKRFETVVFTTLWLKICVSMSTIKMFVKAKAIAVPWIWRLVLRCIRKNFV